MDGLSGISCWDLDGNGVGDPASEDSDGNGLVDAADCRGSVGGITKANVYAVESTTGSPCQAYCVDEDDVLMTGGCWVGAPGLEYGRPVNADDPTSLAGFECFASGGPTCTAHAVCLSVD